MLGEPFPMITAHKVLAAYACLAPRVITGQFDPTVHRAIWPSTGNYARGGVAISRIMGCRGVAVLPEGMSQERFDWLDRWVADPADVIRTPGSESNVKEIYDACNALAARSDQRRAQPVLRVRQPPRPPRGHRPRAGRACSTTSRPSRPGLRLAAFVSATGSAGTIAAGDRLKERYGARIVAVEALECPTMLENGFGEHNIQGIGDKHIPLIHNVMNTDVVVAVSDRATDELDVLFNTDAGRRLPGRARGASTPTSSTALAPLRLLVDLQRARGHQDGEAARPRARRRRHHHRHRWRRPLRQRAGQDRGRSLRRRRSASVDAAEVFAEHLASVGTDHVVECTEQDRNRIFNLGYYTWVEQQGTPLEVFEARRSQQFWQELRTLTGGVGRADRRVQRAHGPVADP